MFWNPISQIGRLTQDNTVISCCSFFIFPNEIELTENHPWSYFQKLKDQIMVDVLNANWALVELYADVVDEIIETTVSYVFRHWPTTWEHAPVEEEPGGNEVKDDDITFGVDQIVNHN